jgi:RNA polymerase sigma-70 factor (ECF subfamily)
MEHLTPKRQQILHYGLFGLKNHEIAEIMGVSVNTLKTQKSHAYRKLRAML